MAAQKREINLLLAKSLETNTLGRVLAWVLSSFRIIVIVTEIIVMVAFLSRFWLDAQNSDLNDKIKNKTAMINASSEFIKEFKDVQNRLIIAKQLVNQKSYAEIVKTITPLIPQDTILTQISLSENEFGLSGISQNSISIHQFVVNLHSIDQFSNVALQEIMSDKETNALNFKINANIKNE